MMTSSVISVMIGIGICDSLSMLVAIIVKHVILNLYRDECTIPVGYLFYRIFWVLQYFRADVIRCSTWLGVLMAFTKYLALKFVARPSFKIVSNVSFGFYATFISFFISCLFSLFNYMRIEIVEYGTWTPDKKCGLDVTGTWSLYMMQPSHFYEFLNQYLLKILIFLNAFLTRILPCILLPIITVLLFLELQKTKKKASTNSFIIRKCTERTTSLVIFMAVTYFISSLPAGIFTSFQVPYSDLGIVQLSIFVDHFCNTILTVNASLHCFICFAMSSEYRKTVKEVCRIRPKDFNLNSVLQGGSTVNVSRTQ
ncbi:hypothetical protein CAEBREN_19567 [Caenorhabditis brenneri]|uniref:G-protein coupled receptors family 1 profile domain-containing protein n=1 Tax=Caenorhabditis brenneri TaxID=135651 RepID=G0P0I9_CAEBE|nr:hypothetical protein CAEBREN_19567 [Caenorhabditis brenneri]